MRTPRKAIVALLVALVTSATLQAQDAPKASVPPSNPHKYAPSKDRADADGCRHKLEKVAGAITAYRKEHKDIPNWLSDLVPKHLAAEDLICPVTTKTDGLSPFGALDPKLRCSYLYEFCPTPITATVKSAFPGPMMTNREWKRQQMGVVGSDVPIVRCLLHNPVLNISFGGRVFESPMIWEQMYLDVARMEDFRPH